MKRTLLIDGDIYAYTHASAAEEPWDWGGGQWSITADAVVAAKCMDAAIRRIEKKLEADDVVVALSDPNRRYFRHDLLANYKGGREGKRPPLILRVLKDHLEELYRSFVRPTLEADDVLGILSTHPSLIPGEKIIVSVDKDFKTIPGLYYNLNAQEVTEYSEAEADYWHMYQTLVGDKTDGYRGCPGIGPVKAKRILDADQSWSAVVAVFEKAGLSEEVALIQARVARICRACDYNFDTKEVILWTP